MKDRRSVAPLVETSNSYARGVLEGVVDYVRQHEGWSIFLPEQERGGSPPAWLSRWKGDGIIARIETEEIARTMRRTGLPIVDVSAARHLQTSPGSKPTTKPSPESVWIIWLSVVSDTSHSVATPASTGPSGGSRTSNGLLWRLVASVTSTKRSPISTFRIHGTARNVD